jgi:hypothetical protein
LPGIRLKLLCILAAAAMVAASAGARAEDGEDDQADTPQFPTTEFADGAKGATVTVGDLTASISMVRRKKLDPNFDTPLLTVTVGGETVLEATGAASGLDPPATEASIAEIDPANDQKEVYFASFSGGAHCCTELIVAEKAGDKWVSVPLGEFDGDGNYLDDIDGDGHAEIVTMDNRFLYKFDSYALSAAPLTIMTVSNGKPVDISTEPRFLKAHRQWLARLVEGVDPVKRWSTRGFLAGWVAAKTRVGEGADAFRALVDHWDGKDDQGEDVCVSGVDLDKCAKRNIAHLKFPDALKLFLDQTGYHF